MTRVRVSRVGEQIKKELSEIIQQEIKDPRIGFVTVTRVEMSGDLQIAKVYISVMGDEEKRKETLAGLQKATGYMRREIGQRVPMRYTPELIFVIDQTLDHSEQIHRLLDEVHKEKREE